MLGPQHETACVKFNRTTKHWEQESKLQESVKKRYSSMKLLSEGSTDQPWMWMMVSEIELVYAESFEALVQTLIPDSLLRLNEEQSISSSYYKVSSNVWK